MLGVFFPETILGYSIYPPLMESILITTGINLMVFNEFQSIYTAVNRLFAIFFPIKCNLFFGIKATLTFHILYYLDRIRNLTMEHFDRYRESNFMTFSPKYLAHIGSIVSPDGMFYWGLALLIFPFLINVVTFIRFYYMRNFGSYKYLLVIFPSLGILFATVELILYPEYMRVQFPCYPFNLSIDTGRFLSKKDLLERYNLSFSEISSLALVAFNADGSLRWFNISCTFNMTATMLFQYTVILYCAIWMYFGMEEKLRSLSLSMKKLHKQLFKTLVLQIVTPTISLFIPAFFIIYLPFFDLKIDLPTGIFLCAFTIYPAMDAIIVISVECSLNLEGGVRKDLLERYNLTFSVALVTYNEDGSLRWFNISCTFNMTTILLLQYTVILYCAIWMYHGMGRKLQSLSSSMRNLHKQLFKTLILQIITPTISLFFPAVFIIYLTFFDFKVDLPTGLSLCAFTIYPAMDAMIVMYVVADYKKAANRILKKLVDKAYNWINGLDEEGNTKEINANIPAALKAL
ncbi:hypothetical protein L3Y34_009007 [Caenorhabditis briggsae]|uniref:7TM GPCR serpentine receptor class x (Srx) domain-containing protein n=2 Tax=Caenorhabditis briggsae TaxID=6238 RepID=A0AAE9D1E8_CAEBR|nr:hypothetical protein L3Y34_009007 [Caenorhabditis briggsae]